MRPFQILFNTTLLTAQQKDALADFDRWCDINVPAPVSVEERQRAATEARLAGTGVDGAFAVLQGIAAQAVVKHDSTLFDELGTDGVYAALAGENLIRCSWKSDPLPGLTREDAFKAAVLLKHRFGHVPNAGDVAWACFNRALEIPENARSVQHILFSMAMHLAAENRDYTDILRQKWKLWASECGAVPCRVRVVAWEDCAASKRAAVQTYTLEQVAAAPPIPCSDCDAEPFVLDGKPWCRCILVREFG